MKQISDTCTFSPFGLCWTSFDPVINPTSVWDTERNIIFIMMHWLNESHIASY